MSVLPTYDEVFLSAWQRLLNDYGKVKFRSEQDIVCHLFSECLKSMKDSEFETPYKIHANLRPYPYKIDKVADLILGDNEVVVEIKLLRRHESATTDITRKAKADVVSKLGEYVKLGAKHAYFVMVDEHGHSKRHIWGKWKTVKVGNSESHFLLLKVIKDKVSGEIHVLSEPEISSRS